MNTQTHLNNSGTNWAGFGFCAMASSSDMPGHSTGAARAAPIPPMLADMASRPAMLNDRPALPPPDADADAEEAAGAAGAGAAPALARRALKSRAAGAGADAACPLRPALLVVPTRIMSPFLMPASPNFLCPPPPLAELPASYTILPSTVKVIAEFPEEDEDSSAMPNAVDSEASSSSVVDVDDTTMLSAMPLRLVRVTLISSELDMIAMLLASDGVWLCERMPS